MCERVKFTVSAAQIFFKTEVAGCRFQGAEPTEDMYRTKIMFSNTSDRSGSRDIPAALQRLTAVFTFQEIKGVAKFRFAKAFTNTEGRV